MHLKESIYQHVRNGAGILALFVVSSESYNSRYVGLWELDHREGWAPKNWCFWIVVLEKTLERPLDCRDIKPINLQGNQPWILTGRTDDEAEAPILWPPDGKSWLAGKDADAGKDWEQKEERMGWLDSNKDSMDLSLSKLWEIVEDRGAWGQQSIGSHRVRHDLATKRQLEATWETVELISSSRGACGA